MYEHHDYSDIKFPIIFHRNHIYPQGYPDTPKILSRTDIIGSGLAHWHEGIEILRFTGKSGSVQINSDTINVSAGNVVVIGSGDLHRVIARDDVCTLDCLIINYEVCTEWGFDLSDISFESIIDDVAIYSLFDKISKEFSDKNPYYKKVVLSCCMEILALLFRHHADTGKLRDDSATKKAQLVRQIMNYIKRKFGEKITLSTLSTEFKYSYFYLEHIFSSFTDTSIREFISDTRIREAKKMLLSSNIPISEVAENCGYSNAAAFSTAFRKKTGFSPTEYKKINQKQENIIT